jgi:hypothetical protein
MHRLSKAQIDILYLELAVLNGLQLDTKDSEDSQQFSKKVRDLLTHIGCPTHIWHQRTCAVEHLDEHYIP